MNESKYEYKPVELSESAVASIQLKQGQTGVIYRVDLYRDGDYFRGRPDVKQWMRIDYRLPLESARAFRLFSDSSKTIPATLEECTEEHLELLNSIEFKGGQKLPLEELKQIQSLQVELKSSRDKYRGN